MDNAAYLLLRVKCHTTVTIAFIYRTAFVQSSVLPIQIFKLIRLFGCSWMVGWLYLDGIFDVWLFFFGCSIWMVIFLYLGGCLVVV